MHKASHRDMLAFGAGADIAGLGVPAPAAASGNPNGPPPGNRSAHFFDVVKGLSTLTLLGESRYEDEIIRRISDEYRPRTMSALRAAFYRQLEEMMEERGV
jgi:hypothetical protein